MSSTISRNCGSGRFANADRDSWSGPSGGRRREACKQGIVANAKEGARYIAAGTQVTAR